MQLCRQVQRTLSLVLSGEFDDDILLSLHVVSVVPAPDASQLMVTVQCLSSDPPIEPTQIIQRLHAVTGKLRSEVASAISRRKTPGLLFQVMASS